MAPITPGYPAGVGTVLALDVGGTKLAAAVVRDDGTIVSAARRPTEGGDGEELFGHVVSLLDEVGSLAGSERPSALGVGCGGPMEPGGRSVSPLNIPQWRRFPLADRLTSATGLPTRIDNDAKALALGEGRWGAAVGVDDYLAMVVSTGVGGGIVLGGSLLDGHAGNAGHIGHVVVEPLGRVCACGARGCLEAEASGTAIAAITGAPAAEAPVEVRVRTGRLVGRAVASVCNLLDLQLAVVAGSVAFGFGADLLEAANAELERCARLDFSREARIVPSGCGTGDTGPLLGAAAVALRE